LCFVYIHVCYTDYLVHKTCSVCCYNLSYVLFWIVLPPFVANNNLWELLLYWTTFCECLYCTKQHFVNTIVPKQHYVITSIVPNKFLWKLLLYQCHSMNTSIVPITFLWTLILYQTPFCEHFYCSQQYSVLNTDNAG